MKVRVVGVLSVVGLWLCGAGLQARPVAETSPALRAARALVERVLPDQASDFVEEAIPSDKGRDVFEVASRGGKVVLKGNNPVSIASGLNWYLEHACHCDISWQCGNQLRLPRSLPRLAKPVRVVSPHHYRYAYNFCTHGYTMAWWSWPQWRRELDFLAMHGINLALIIEGQDAVWIRTLEQFGYTGPQVRAWLVMPSHQPWMQMDNIQGYGGPVPNELVRRRVRLGRRILDRMRALGIQPVLPGYYGMVPPDFYKRYPKADVHHQGLWAHMKRPDILDATDPMFARVAKAYYQAEKRLFGSVHYYDADPFHEGGSTKNINLPAEGKAIDKAMDGATWVLQGWQANPRQKMINALDKNKLLVLDLFCEVRQDWRRRHNYEGTPWLWCTIGNFGGNTDMGGKLGWMAEGPVQAMHDPDKGRMSGIGAMMEGVGSNPVIWELFLRNAWSDTVPNLQAWLDQYAWRRYGANIPAADKAWKILAQTVYHPPLSSHKYVVNTVVCGRPSLKPVMHFHYISDTQPYYNPTRLVPAWKLLIKAASRAKHSAGYRFDLCDVGRQVLGNLATRYDDQIIAAYNRRNAATVRRLSRKMLGLIEDMNTLVGTQPELLLGRWLAEARSWGQTQAQKNLCERNARELLTVWTRNDNIPDYANREWNGLLGDFYYHRWAMWFKAMNQALAQGKPLNPKATRQKIADWELWWTRQSGNGYATRPHGDVVAISRSLYDKYAADASAPLPKKSQLTAKAR